MFADSRKKKLKIGVVGVGHMGHYHVNVLSSMLTHRLVGVYDSSWERAQQIASKYETKAVKSLPQLLERCDAVVVAVPTALHYEISKIALDAGCHILVEKPVTRQCLRQEI